MAPPSYADVTRKEEYFEILDETIRTNPYRKAATAMASVMSKHGITSDASNVLGKPSAGLPERKCALTKALRLAQNCNQKLHITKDELQALCCDLELEKSWKLAEQMDKNNNNDISSTTPAESPSDRAVMTGHLLTLIGEPQTIAKRIYETAVGLHVAEDYLRQPEDLKLLDFSPKGRIQIPNYNFNHASQLCLEWLHATAIKWLRGFKEDGGANNAQFITVFENFTKAVKDYTEAVCLANQVFRVLLYPNEYGKETLKEYVSSLGYVLKNDIMMEIQSLRRAFDSIQYSFERLGWAASIAWMKYSGKNITVETLNESGIQVDHSIFHHKFYEGPSKIQKKDKTESSSSSINSTLKAPINSGHKATNKLSTSRSTKSAINDSRIENTEESSMGSSVRLSSPQVNPVSVETQPMSKISQSKPEVTKPQKVQRANKGKVKQVGKKIAATKTEVDTPTESVVSVDNSNPTLGLLKLLKSDKKTSSAASHSQSTIDASNTSTTKLTPLTPPPIIPPAWRKQFGAVFGTHLVSPIGSSTKKLKKKKKANGVTVTTGQKKQVRNAVGAVRNTTSKNDADTTALTPKSQKA